MVVSNWDSHLGNYLYYNQLLDADLDCDGTLSWTNVKPGETVEGSFEVSNIGDPFTLLNWEIESYPDWGTWTFDPESGDDLTPEEGSVIVNVEVIAPDERDTEFLGEIKVVNQDDPDDSDIIPVSLNLEVEPGPVFEIISITGGMGVSIEFENVGNGSATNVDWNIKVTGGILNLINVNKGSIISSMATGARETVKTGIFLGLGKINIEFTVDCDEGASVDDGATGTQIIIFTKIS